MEYQSCRRCHGTGKMRALGGIHVKCDQCGGTGFMKIQDVLKCEESKPVKRGRKKKEEV